MVNDQAIAELSTSVGKLRSELEKAWGERSKWKKMYQDNIGLETRTTEDDAGGTEDDGDL